MINTELLSVPSSAAPESSDFYYHINFASGFVTVRGKSTTEAKIVDSHENQNADSENVIGVFILGLVRNILKKNKIIGSLVS